MRIRVGHPRFLAISNGKKHSPAPSAALVARWAGWVVAGLVGGWVGWWLGWLVVGWLGWLIGFDILLTHVDWNGMD